jgi:Mrp family chromosome partitioning ATPase
MSKIFEALQVAEKETRSLDKVEPKPPAKTGPSSLQPLQSEADYLNDMVILYQNIESRLGDLDKKTIQFIGAREGEGTSTIVREFARIAAQKLRKSVFLFDAGRYNPHQQHVFYHIGPECDWQQITRNGNLIEGPACTEAMDIEAYLDPPGANPSPINFYSARIVDFWESLKERYDLILIDSIPASVSPDGIEIARRVDGVILVVEAEKTRWPVVESLKERILNGGGNILGIVLNKRRLHIPDAIYKRL